MSVLNPYVAEKVAEYRRLRAQVDDMQTRAHQEGRDLTADELAEVESLATRARNLYDQFAEDIEEAKRVAAIADMTGRLHSARRSQPVIDEAALPYSLVPSIDQLRAAEAALREHGQHFRIVHPRVSEHLRSTVGASDVGGGVVRISGELPAPRRLVETVGLTPVMVDSAGGSGPVFGATSGTAPTDEGDPKPEADSITAGTIPIKALARWTDVSRMALLSGDLFLSDLMSWHAQFLAKDEDLLIVTALEQAAGTPLPAGENGAGVRTALAVVADAVSADPDVIVCHPTDYAAITAFSPSSGSDVESFAARIGTALIYPTSAATPGTVTVAALRAAGRFLVASPPTTASTENLKTNEITVRTEEFVGFGLRLAGAVASVELDGSPS